MIPFCLIRSKLARLCLVTVVGMVSPVPGMANYVQIANLALSNIDTVDGALSIRFDLSWNNSWRYSGGIGNWDAVWLFGKFRVGSTDPTFSSVMSVGNLVTVSSTKELRVGMSVRVTGGTGVLVAGTVIQSITNDSQFVVSSAPTTPLSNASVKCNRIWEHIRFRNSGHTVPTGATLDPGLLTPGSAYDSIGNPLVGVFMYRSSAGSGSVAFNGVKLRWNYSLQGVKNTSVIDFQLFAVEMVYVSGGVAFNVGGGGGVSNFTSTTINTSAATTAPSGSGSLGGQAGGYPTGQSAPASDSWPNGYSAFYCMKYEASQGQYRDFLNTLTRSQQMSRMSAQISFGTTNVFQTFVMFPSSGIIARNGIRCAASIDAFNPISVFCDLNANGIADEIDDGEWIAANIMNWSDNCAYLDWSGLRPMTELEFEKACRGNLPALGGELAWGSDRIVSATSLTNSGTIDEKAGNADANAVFANGTDGPIRVGSFAGNSTRRIQSGASFYGIMDMTGNVVERTVTIGNVDGRAFIGNHGDGIISANGFANESSWPGLVNGEVSGAAGSGYRGGAYGDVLTTMRVSGRGAATSQMTSRHSFFGIRGVRSAP